MSTKRPFLIIALALTLILSACAPAAPSYSDAEIQQTVEIVVALTALALNATDTAAAPPPTSPPSTSPPSTSPPSTSPPPTPTPPPPTNPPAAATVVVIFTPGGLFDDAKRAEFYARIINPYIDYYAELAQSQNYPNLVSINIQTFDTPGYPYGADAIFDNQGYEGWLIAETGGVVDVWIPECINGPCPLTQDFIDAYPEIAATSQAQ